MNDRMETNIERTIENLRSSMPTKLRRQTTIFTLLRVAVSEMNPVLLTCVLCGILVCGYIFTDILSMPTVTVFCTTPLPLLLLFHSYVLRQNEAMRELEDTFCYSYAEMLIARCMVISAYAVLSLVCLCVMVHLTSSVSIIRLLLCGALPTVYLSAALLGVAAKVRSPESISIVAIALWLALCFAMLYFPLNELLLHTSLITFTILLIVGLVLYSISIIQISRRTKYAIHFL